MMRRTLINFHYAVHILLAHGRMPEHVVDVGLHNGLFMDFWKHCCKRITAFEPHPASFREIRDEYIARQPVDEQPFLEVRDRALGVTPLKTLPFHVCKTLPAYSTQSLLRRSRVEAEGIAGEEDWEEIIVEQSTLDAEFPTETDINIIKIDTEHNDLMVAVGGRTLIQRCRPLLQMEHIRYTEEQRRECDALMYSLSYRMIEPTIATDNYYFIPEEWRPV